MCKRACFAMQKGTFYKPLCNLLILRRLQSRFLMIMSWFANKNTLRFVRVFQKPLPDPLRRERGIISGIPRYVWEDIKRCLRVLGLVLKKKSKQVACYKLRIYELKNGELCAKNYEFTNWRSVDSVLKTTNLRIEDRWIACFKLRIYELTDRWIACYKLRIYELTSRWITCYKMRFYE